MKLDKELVREILIELEVDVIKEREASEKATYVQHAIYLTQEGFIEGTYMTESVNGKNIAVGSHDFSLLFKGHELLSSIREDRIWDAIKWHLNHMNLSLDSVSFETIQEMARHIVLRSMKE